MSFFEKAGIESNPVLDRLPRHLLQYIKPQRYEHYTPIDQAVWKYVMRKNVDYLQQVAHPSYLEGLGKCGISIDEIPSMYGMNRILEKIGWAAVAVDGLIPTPAFLEFQAYNVLVIASDIRALEDIEYTPVPDIIHESAGHAPIIANPEYSEFLRRLGQIGCRAISSPNDELLQSAVRVLTDLKTSGHANQEKIRQAEARVVELQDTQQVSEMTAIKNLHWWSVEYGLIGDLKQYKIYGAGLLSSIGESKWCMSDQVHKLPYSLETAYQNFDYTRPQPQLFVTPDFAHLSYVVEAFANQMALRTGGLDALEKLITSQKLGTIEMSTGIQISGHFTRAMTDERGKVAYFITEGDTALAYREKELIGHGILNHPQGFGSPVGKLKGINLAIEDMYPKDLEAYHIYEGRKVKLEFTSGVTVEGQVVTGIRNLKGKILLIRFRDCLVQFQGKTLFTPKEGIYDMAVGKEVTSGYTGPADINSFNLIHHVVENKTNSVELNAQLKNKMNLYRQVNEITKGNLAVEQWDKTLSDVSTLYPEEWLLLLNGWEVAMTNNQQKWIPVFSFQLDKLIEKRPEIAHLIREGMSFGAIEKV